MKTTLTEFQRYKRLMKRLEHKLQKQKGLIGTYKDWKKVIEDSDNER